MRADYSPVSRAATRICSRSPSPATVGSSARTRAEQSGRPHRRADAERARGNKRGYSFKITRHVPDGSAGHRHLTGSYSGLSPGKGAEFAGAEDPSPGLPTSSRTRPTVACSAVEQQHAQSLKYDQYHWTSTKSSTYTNLLGHGPCEQSAPAKESP
jgi:hypothetical protein